MREFTIDVDVTNIKPGNTSSLTPLHIAADVSTLYYATVNERIETVRIHGKANGIDINVSNEITSAPIHSSP
jgi:hypothetical protein